MVAPLYLEGDSVRLTPLKLGHIDELCSIGLDPALWSSTTTEVRSPAEMKSYVHSAIDAAGRGEAIPFVITDRASARLVGTTRFHTIVPEHKHLEIGFTWIALPWQRTIVNTETKYMMLCYAFEEMKYIRIEFKADAENRQSRRALVRIGAREEGILRSYRLSAHRGVRDLAVYSIIAAEWPTVRAALAAKLYKRPNQHLRATGQGKSGGE